MIYSNWVSVFLIKNRSFLSKIGLKNRSSLSKKRVKNRSSLLKIGMEKMVFVMKNKSFSDF